MFWYVTFIAVSFLYMLICIADTLSTRIRILDDMRHMDNETFYWFLAYLDDVNFYKHLWYVMTLRDPVVAYERKMEAWLD